MYIIESEKTKMDSKSSKVVSNKKKLHIWSIRSFSETLNEHSIDLS
ncbi:23909_t:CDS:2 [Entrophospora sp. SA101]|nr:23909_t:CDS:2 [Entrophospora sp. SA101]